MTSEFTIAVHSMVYLYHHKGMVYSSETLAENICTNAARIRKVMSKLKKAGYVETKEGIIGGYQILENDVSITLYDIAKALDVVFVSNSWKSGNPDMECLIASGMANVLSGVFQELDMICYEQLKKITIEDIDKKLRKAKK